MYKLTLFFLYAVLMDGVFSFIAALSRAKLFETLGGWITLFLLVLAGVIFAGTVLTPRLPKRIVLPPILFIAFCIIWAVLFSDAGQLPLSLAEILLALGLLIGYRNPDGGFQSFAESRPVFSLRNFMLTAPLFGLVTLLLISALTLGFAQKMRSKAEESLDNYVTLQRDGLSMEERRFRNGDQEIRLIAMMHVARGGFYDEIAKALPANANAVVLVEGVTDKNKVLGGKLDYRHFASLAGISSQADSTFNRKAMQGLKQQAREADDPESEPLPVEYRSGDIDASEFSPATIRCIKAVSIIFQSASLPELLQNYKQSDNFIESDTEAALKDIVEHRNEHLLCEIQKALEDHRTIVVPWGAQHMPGLQREIKRWGFVETGRTRRRALHFDNEWLMRLVSVMDSMPGSSENRGE